MKDSDILGVGWSEGAGLKKIDDCEKFLFKINRERAEKLCDRIEFQNDIELDSLEIKLAETFGDIKPIVIPETKLTTIKRKSDSITENSTKKKIIVIEDSPKIVPKSDPDIVDLLSDSDNEMPILKNSKMQPKKEKLEPINEDSLETNVKEENIKTEFTDNNLEYEAFSVKQEQNMMSYDEEPINLDSDSDSESELERSWFMRLSQSSPGKSLREDRAGTPLQESSYSQIDEVQYDSLLDNKSSEEEEFIDDLIIIPEIPLQTEKGEHEDQVDGYNTGGISSDYFAKLLEKETEKQQQLQVAKEVPNEAPAKKSQMIDALFKTKSKKSHKESKYL